jgi:hypothetical protein
VTLRSEARAAGGTLSVKVALRAAVPARLGSEPEPPEPPSLRFCTVLLNAWSTEDPSDQAFLRTSVKGLGVSDTGPRMACPSCCCCPWLTKVEWIEESDSPLLFSVLCNRGATWSRDSSITASTARGISALGTGKAVFLPIVRVPSRMGPLEVYSAVPPAPSCLIEAIRRGGGTTTQVSVLVLVFVLSCGAPAKISISAVVPSGGGDRITGGIGGGAIAFVVDLPPTPENSTFTVVADAARAGPNFGTNRVLRVWELFEWLKEGGSSLRGCAKSLEMGAIQLWPAGFVEASLLISFSLSGYNALSLILGAKEGSRMTSLSVDLICPSSTNTSRKNLNSPRKSLRVTGRAALSSSSSERYCCRRAFTSEIMLPIVDLDKCPTSAPLRCCRFRRLVRVKGSV